MTARDQRDRLLVVHAHAQEGLAHVLRRRERIRISARALGVDVDETHLRGRQRGVELALALVALGVEPDLLRAPVHVVVGLPHVGAAAAEAERREAHRLQRDVAGQDDEVGPRDRLAVLLLDGPQHAPCAVEQHVVGPRVQRSEPLHARPAAAAAVVRPVGAGRVPGHAHHERAVVAEVCGPPLLRSRERLGQVGLEGIEIEPFERVLVIEVGAERVRDRGVLRKDLEVQPVRPPLGIGTAARRVHAAPAVVGHVAVMRVVAGNGRAVGARSVPERAGFLGIAHLRLPVGDMFLKN